MADFITATLTNIGAALTTAPDGPIAAVLLTAAAAVTLAVGPRALAPKDTDHDH